MINSVKITLILTFLAILIIPPSFQFTAQASETPTTEFTASVTTPFWSTFTPTGSMNFARRQHKMVRLQTGLILTSGDTFDPIYGASAELYDPTTGTWRLTGNMNISRTGHTLTVLDDGKVLAVGGDVLGNPLLTAEIYNPSTETWTPTGSINGWRQGFSTTLLDDGKVLLSGGWDGYPTGIYFEDTYLFEPSAGTWSLTGTIHTGRYRPTSALLNDGKVLLVGGSASGVALNTTERFDPLVGIWLPSSDLSIGRYYHTMNTLLNGQVIVTGGIYNNAELATTEIYDPSPGTWSLTTSMNYPRKEHTGTTLGTGNVLVTGGSIENTVLKITELYDPSTFTWSMIAPMNTNRRYHAAELLNDTQVLVSGGYDGVSSAINSAEIGTIYPENTLTGTLTLPSGWVNNSLIPVQIIGTSSRAPIAAAALSSDGQNWGDWLDLSSGVKIETTWNAGTDAENIPIHLRLRDIYNQVADIVIGSVDVDTTAPTGSLTIETTTGFSGQVTLHLIATDTLSGIASMQISSHPDFTDAAWEPFSDTYLWNMSGAISVFVRFIDNAGNISAIYSAPNLFYLPLIIR